MGRFWIVGATGAPAEARRYGEIGQNSHLRVVLGGISLS